jgi:RsiW-degrading membrane proteinase PrsW (M82 family)
MSYFEPMTTAEGLGSAALYIAGAAWSGALAPTDDGQMAGVVLGARDVRVGRLRENDIVVLDQGVSRAHAVIRWAAGRYEIEDSGSTGGTIVDGRRIVGPVTLMPGSAIHIGNTTLTFRVSPAASRGTTAAPFAPAFAPTPTLVPTPTPLPLPSWPPLYPQSAYVPAAPVVPSSPIVPPSPPAPLSPPPAVTLPPQATARPSVPSRVGGWLRQQVAMSYWKVFLVGLVALLIAENVLGSTKSVPAIVVVLVLGAALAPMTFLFFCLDLARKDGVPVKGVVVSGICGATISLLLAVLAEALLLPDGSFRLVCAITIGVCEESAKALAVVWFIRSRRVWSLRQGLALGVAAGAGFAIVETIGYALSMGLWTTASGHASTRALNLDAMNEMLLLRGSLAIFCHVTWTALVVTAIWRARRQPKAQAILDVGVAFGLAVLLHALWDWQLISLPGIVAITLFPGMPLLMQLFVAYASRLVLGVVGLLALSALLWEDRRLARSVPSPAPDPLVRVLGSYVVHVVRLPARWIAGWIGARQIPAAQTPAAPQLGLAPAGSGVRPLTGSAA